MGQPISPLARISRFHSLITVPQVAIFTVFALIALADRAAVAELWLTLSVIAYQLAFDLIVRWRVRVFTLRLMAIYYTLLIGILSVVTLFGGLAVDQNLLLPTALSVLNLGRISVGPRQMLKLISLPVATSVVAAALGLFLGASTLLVAPSVAFFMLSLASLIVLTIARRQEELSASLRYPTPIAVRMPRSRIEQDRRSFSFGEPLHAEIRSEFGWRLPILALVQVALVFGSAFTSGVREVDFHLSLLSVILVQVVLYHLLLSARSFPRLMDTALLFFVTLILMWSLVLIFGFGPEMLPELLLAILIFAFGLLPWSTKYLVVGGTLLGLTIGFRAAISPYPLLVFVIGSGFLVVALRLSAISYLTVISRITSYLAAELSRRRVTAYQLAKESAAQLTALCNSRSALIFSNDHQAQVVGETVIESDLVSTSEQELLLEVFKEIQGDQGIIGLERFNERIRTLFIDVFDHAPPSLLFIRYSTIDEEIEDTVVALYPYTFASWLAGETRVLQALIGAVSTIRAVLDIRALDARSSAALAVSRTRESLRISEFNQVVHHVNNVAQDVYAACEEVRRGVLGPTTTGNSPDLSGALAKLESAVRVLASGVSDAKIMQELSEERAGKDREDVEVGSVVEELIPLGDYWANRASARFSVKMAPNLRISTLGREFLFAVLHLLIRTACRHAKANTEIELCFEPAGASTAILIRYRGIQVVAEGLLVDVSEGSSESVTHGAKNNLIAVRRFVELSNGQYHYESSSDDGAHEFRLTLPSGTSPRTMPSSQNAWALIVDDSEDLVVFYARVIEAHKLSYRVAKSQAEAFEMIKRNIAPAIAIVDLFLAEGSGLVVLERLRETYANAVPSLVITGYDDQTLEEKAMAAGASKFLLKPVNRRQLYEEIRELLVSRT